MAELDARDAIAGSEAVLSAVSFVAILAGRRAIKRKQTERHRAWMITATAASATFLVLFVIRFVLYGPTPFLGEGVIRGVFWTIYFAHEPLGVANVVLVIAALLLALRGKVELHREVAPMAWGVWLFVSATGVVLWVFLYLPRLV